MKGRTPIRVEVGGLVSVTKGILEYSALVRGCEPPALVSAQASRRMFTSLGAPVKAQGRADACGMFTEL